MNSRGQTYLLLIMLAMAIIIVALALAGPLKSFIDDARAPTTDTAVGLDCNNSSISNFDKASCIATDALLPYFIGFLLFLGGAVLAAKLFLQ